MENSWVRKFEDFCVGPVSILSGIALKIVEMTGKIWQEFFTLTLCTFIALYVIFDDSLILMSLTIVASGIYLLREVYNITMNNYDVLDKANIVRIFFLSLQTLLMLFYSGIIFCLMLTVLILALVDYALTKQEAQEPKPEEIGSVADPE